MSDDLPARMLERAMAVAARAHAGQTDKTGRPMIDHCRRVAAGVKDMEAKTVAYLHDIVEKNTAWTPDRLRTEGFSDRVVQAVDAMTRRSGEDDMGLARRAASNPLAREVKRADLQDNIGQARETGKDASRHVGALDMLVREGFLDAQ